MYAVVEIADEVLDDEANGYPIFNEIMLALDEYGDDPIVTDDVAKILEYLGFTVDGKEEYEAHQAAKKAVDIKFAKMRWDVANLGISGMGVEQMKAKLLLEIAESLATIALSY